MTPQATTPSRGQPTGVRRLVGDVRELFSVVLPLAVVSGLLVGGISVFAHQHWSHSFHHLALHELVANLNRYLYICLIFGPILLLVLSALRLCMRPLPRLILFLLIVSGLGYLVVSFSLPYRLDLAWSDLGSPAKLLIVLLHLVALDIVIGRKWLRPRRSRAYATLLLTCLLLPLLANLGLSVWGKKLQAGLREKSNVIVLVVDALRADRLSCLGYWRDTTPTLDALAARGALFTEAVSNSNHTRATVPSFFTLLFPSTHGVRGITTESADIMPSRITTLAEVLKEAGYSTLAFLANPNMKRKWNFAQGFDIYDDQLLFRLYPGISDVEKFETVKKMNRKLLGWLRANKDRRFFAYLHYTDVHAPYVPPPPYDQLYYDDTAPPRPITEAEYRRLPRYQRLPKDRGDLNYYIARYDAEIRYTDDQIGDLLQELERMELLEQTVIFVTADHGEAFLEHGDWEHGGNLYDEMVHVPLIARFPGDRFGGQRHRAAVHTFDIAATVLDLAGLEPPPGAQARSLLPLLRGESEAIWDYAFVENLDKELRALRNADWKYIDNYGEGRHELYALRRDPGETTDLAAEDPELAERFRATMTGFLDEHGLLAGRFAHRRKELDPETIEELRALGYIE